MYVCVYVWVACISPPSPPHSPPHNHMPLEKRVPFAVCLSHPHPGLVFNPIPCYPPCIALVPVYGVSNLSQYKPPFVLPPSLSPVPPSSVPGAESLVLLCTTQNRLDARKETETKGSVGGDQREFATVESLVGWTDNERADTQRTGQWVASRLCIRDAINLLLPPLSELCTIELHLSRSRIVERKCVYVCKRTERERGRVHERRRESRG